MPRLIDADALFPYGAVPYVKNDGFKTANKLYGIIKNAPTIEAEPVKHGRWEKSEDGDGAVCSHCKEDFCNIIHETDRFKRCPNCGAKTQKAEED